MTLGRSVRIYLADGGVSGIRHGEIVNWTGQAIACPRSRFPELKDWAEAKRPGVYFLFGHDEDSGQEAVYVGEAENVIERLYTHLGGKEFWNELIAFTSKDDNLTKAHVKYLESRLVQLVSLAERYSKQNFASPQLPTLPRADRDAMEEFLEGIRVLLGVLGHRVLEPLIARPKAIGYVESEVSAPEVAKLAATSNKIAVAASQPQTFQLKVSNLIATAMRTDEGLVVRANSEAALQPQPSLSAAYRAVRARLQDAGVIRQSGDRLTFVRDHLFPSPSQAAAIVVGYAINGREAWRTPNGQTFSEYEARIARDTYAAGAGGP